MNDGFLHQKISEEQQPFIHSLNNNDIRTSSKIQMSNNYLPITANYGFGGRV